MRKELGERHLSTLLSVFLPSSYPPRVLLPVFLVGTAPQTSIPPVKLSAAGTPSKDGSSFKKWVSDLGPKYYFFIKLYELFATANHIDDFDYNASSERKIVGIILNEQIGAD
jgi:hypothetical protein